MENKQKKQYSKRRYPNQEIAPELTLKAPPPTPCISLKQRSGSVPDVRIDVKKDKMFHTGFSHRNCLSHVSSHTNKSAPKTTADLEGKRSTSDHAMANLGGRTGLWMVVCRSPCTSNLLHSVRQRLMNL